ncbi:MAG: phosphoenolpyruvate carboxykinase [Thermoanaerobacter sp.]|nr:phosphoenolpyruvate carboxykinase [Thermoanaerobacter sp.]
MRRVIPGEEINNPSLETLKELASHEAQATVYGSVNFITRVRNRSAKFTYIVEDGVQLGVDQQGISRQRALVRLSI